MAAATARARGAADGGKAARTARGIEGGVKRSKKGASHPREMELLMAATRNLARGIRKNHGFCIKNHGFCIENDGIRKATATTTHANPGTARMSTPLS